MQTNLLWFFTYNVFLVLASRKFCYAENAAIIARKLSDFLASVAEIAGEMMLWILAVDLPSRY